MSTYFLVLTGSIIFPFLLSFDKKVAFYKSWRYLFPAIFMTGILFIFWDVIFTKNEIWGFSKEHLTGIYIFSLPLEELLFFVVIPYASVFTFEVVRAYFPGLSKPSAGQRVNIVLLGASILLAGIFYNRVYTFSTFLTLAIVLGLHYWLLKREWITQFYVSFLLVLIPFLIVNGILTGTAIPGEVVWYNSGGIMGLRLGTIPVEDVFYGLNLILINVTLYDLFRNYRHAS